MATINLEPVTEKDANNRHYLAVTLCCKVQSFAIADPLSMEQQMFQYL
jgi:hypothetical protein